MHPFSSAKVISTHFCTSPSTVKEILRQQLKKLRVDASQKLLSLLEMHAEHYFEEIATADESRFQYSSYSDSIFADSREIAVRRIPHDISGQKTMITIFFTFTRFLVLEGLAKGTKSNQDYFVHAIFPELDNEKRWISRKRCFPVFSAHMAKSICFLQIGGIWIFQVIEFLINTKSLCQCTFAMSFNSVFVSRS
jgi:hypothetical protein